MIVVSYDEVPTTGIYMTVKRCEQLMDKIQGLESDLENAVETAFLRGAREWTMLNYPEQYKHLIEREEKGE